MKKLMVTLSMLALVGLQAQAVVRGSENGARGLMSGPNPNLVDVRSGKPDMNTIHALPMPLIATELTASDALEKLQPIDIQDPELKKSLMALYHETRPLIEQTFNELTPAEKHHLKTLVDNVKKRATALKKFVKDKQNMPIVAMELVKVMAIIDRKKSELATKETASKDLATGFIALQKASDAVKHTLLKFKDEMVKQGINSFTGVAGIGPVIGGTSKSPAHSLMRAIGGDHYQKMLAGAQEYCSKNEGKTSGESCSACIRAQLGRVGIVNPAPGFDSSCYVR